MKTSLLKEVFGLREAYWQAKSISLEPNEWSRILDLLGFNAETESGDREIIAKIKKQLAGPDGTGGSFKQGDDF